MPWSKFKLFILRTTSMLQLLQRGDGLHKSLRPGWAIFILSMLVLRIYFWQLGRDNIGCMLLFLAWCRRTLNFLIVCAVSESWSWWSSFSLRLLRRVFPKNSYHVRLRSIILSLPLHLPHKSTSSTWHTSPTSHVHQLHHLHHLKQPLLHRS